eukprot:SAG31_NODE_2876_length_4970_cov_2.820776_3_plen_103_part_00
MARDVFDAGSILAVDYQEKTATRTKRAVAYSAICGACRRTGTRGLGKAALRCQINQVVGLSLVEKVNGQGHGMLVRRGLMQHMVSCGYLVGGVWTQLGREGT